MGTILTYIKTLTLVGAAILAGIAFALALFVFRRGFLNLALWTVGVAALIVGAVNKVSYS